MKHNILDSIGLFLGTLDGLCMSKEIEIESCMLKRWLKLLKIGPHIYLLLYIYLALYTKYKRHSPFLWLFTTHTGQYVI